MERNWSVAAKNDSEYWERIREIRHPSTSMDRVIEIFDRRAPFYEKEIDSFANYHEAEILGRVMEELVKNKNARILDAAAGTGLVGDELQRKGYENLEALDASAKMLEVARRKNTYKNLICERLGPNILSIDSDTYDVVVMAAALMPNHVKSDCFPEITRIIKKGGYFMECDRYGVSHEDEEYLRVLVNACESLERDGYWRQVKREETKGFPKHDQCTIVFAYQIM